MVLALALGISSSAAAQVRVTAVWDANTDALTAGYQVVVATTPGVPLATLDVGNATSAVLPLPPGASYFVTVRAYTAAGALGPASVEAVVDLSAPPGAPAGFRADTYGSTASLGWSSPMTGGMPLTYLLSVGTAPGAANLVSGASLGNVNSVSGDLPPGIYFARVQAANMLGAGPSSAEVSFQIGGGYRPLGPSGLAVTWTGAVAQLSWTPPSASSGGAMPSSYVVEAGSSPGASNLGSVNVGAVTSFAVPVPPGTFYVRVRGVGASGVSDPSNEIVLQAGQGAPSAPRGLASSGSGSTVTLTWNAPAGNAGVTGYVLEAGTAPGLSNLGVAPVGNRTTLTANVPAGVYYVRVRAVNGSGTSVPSNEVVVRR